MLIPNMFRGVWSRGISRHTRRLFDFVRSRAAEDRRSLRPLSNEWDGIDLRRTGAGPVPAIFCATRTLLLV